MKLHYIKPEIEVIYVNLDKIILINHSEPEITSNIGANENDLFEEDENNYKVNLWE